MEKEEIEEWSLLDLNKGYSSQGGTKKKRNIQVGETDAFRRKM